MDRHKIRLGHTDSVESVNKDNFLGVALKSTFKKLHYNDIKTTVDQYERFSLERAECENYRIILTINPYCSNVLFNPLTEIVMNEGSDDVEDERYWSNDTTMSSNRVSRGIDDDTEGSTAKRIQMICNTEYSKPFNQYDDKSGYTYLPGYDIFDNHILRDLGFHVVEKSHTGGEDVFNTISDYERDAGGNIVKMYKRVNINTKPKKVEKRLHTVDDFLTFEDSVNANLTDENGWFGFINASNLRTTSSLGELSDICCVLNNRKNCEFIEMYPDSTLYSFSPKYNKYRSRLEQNWEVYLTYAAENDYCNELVKNNSLPILTVEKKNGIGGEEIIVFRSYTKHNLKRGDTIKLFYAYPSGGESISVNTSVRIANLGNASNGDKEYYFYVNGVELEFDEGQFEIIENIRFRKVYNGMESKYYMRKMKRIDYDVDAYYDEDFERYKLAFADTIYGDDITQITFTNTVSIKDKRDNLGRPLSELFVTIVKTNYGKDIWYKENDEHTHIEERTLNSDELDAIEFSHCFGDVTCGYILSHEKNDRIKDGIMRKREWMRDARVINNNQKFGSNMPQVEVNGKDVLFDGDIVEFSPEDCMEHVLSDCAFRFNTYQRENPTSDDFRYHEIKTDIYDVTGDLSSFEIELKKVTPNASRDEGYYHKAHYPLKIRGFGGITQMGHNDIRVVDAHPLRAENIMISVRSTLPTKLNNGDTIYLCDDKNGISFEFECTSVQSPTTFRMMPKIPVCEEEDQNNCEKNPWIYFNSEVSQYYDGNTNINWVNLCQLLKTGQLNLRGRNYDIPDYAVKTGNNTYMWRNVLSYGEITDDEVPEYTFANNAFYLTPTIRFYLKRQDPDDTIGLYSKDIFPNDVYGNIQKASNYYYEEEIDNGC